MFNERAKATYIGMTNNLERRVIEHKQGLIPGNSKEKGTDKLAYYEHYKYVNNAIAREKALKEWNRVWKFRLIETVNPEWRDLAEDLNDRINWERKTEEFLAELERKKSEKYNKLKKV